MDMFRIKDRLADAVYNAGRWLESKSFSLRPKFPVEIPNYQPVGFRYDLGEMGFLRLDPADSEIKEAIIRGYMTPRRKELVTEKLALVSPLSDDAVPALDYVWSGDNWNSDNAKLEAGDEI